MQDLLAPGSAVNSFREDTLGERGLLLSALGVAATRLRLQTNIFDTISVALRQKQIDCANALTWLEEEGVLNCLPLGPVRRVINAPGCNACGSSTCDNPGFCRSCRKADRKRAKRQRGWPLADHELPPNWDRMSVGALWDALNHPERHATPQSTIDSIVHSVNARDTNALKEPANLDRLDCCDESAKAQINARLMKLGLRHD